MSGGVCGLYTCPVSEPFYITTPIYYVNDRPHIGHCYTTVVADVAARFARLLGRDVFFLTGTDEHAEKVVAAARERGLTPQAWADRNAAEFQRAFRLLSVAADDFMRTSQDRHKTRASAYIRRLMDSGDVYVGDYTGWFDASQEEYLTETDARAHGYRSPVTGMPLEKRTEKNYFFRLSAYEDRLRAHIERHPAFIQPPARRNEVLARLAQGLNDVPVSRAVKPGDVDWGIRMPGDPGHRVYVWIEALCNYLTAVDTPQRRHYWPATVHLMAKDILWFHAVIWPALLMALGETLPHTIYAHAYFVADGRKMSKSLGNFIEIEQLEAYAQQYSADAVRWYLATQGPLGATDADFSHARFVEVYNAELAHGIGNCVSRVAGMILRYFGGQVPAACPEGEPSRVRRLAGEFAEGIRNDLGPAGMGLQPALLRPMALITEIDRFINETQPFRLAREMSQDAGARARLGNILYECAEGLRIASLGLFPALPGSMARLWRAWDCSPLRDPDDPDSGLTAPLAELARWGGPHSLTSSHRLGAGPPLFMRADPSAAPPRSAPG